MARAEAASASARPDSIKGLAQSIAKPAYRRLLTAEPALRRAVPALIIAFLVTICVGAAVQVIEHHRQSVVESERAIEAIADLAVARLGTAARAFGTDLTLSQHLPRWATDAGRRILVARADGVVVGAMPPFPSFANQQLADILGVAENPASQPGQTGVTTIIRGDGTEVLAALRRFGDGSQIAVLQPRTGALSPWTSDTALTVTLTATTGFVVLILGFAFHWQSTRAREADFIYDTVRSRIDTALNRGRCGLWDWDVANGRIFWSHSMFELLGLPYRDDLLAFGEVNALVHPDDVKLYDLVHRLADTQAHTIDHAFRMRHADGHWLWLRARCELVHQANEPGLHLIGIAVDITEQKQLVEQTMAADLRLRDAIETIPEAFVVWDAENRLVLCNSNFQALHNLPEAAIASGTNYEAVVAAGSKPVVKTRTTSEGDPMPGARTFEAQLDDGRWLHISERRTKDGGYVSVGTDITTLKLHEEKLIESERRLIATINDLRLSQQALEQQTQQLADLAQKYAEEKTRAEEANQAKSKFLANMSHELRTPLNAIIGFSEIMQSGMFGPLGADKYDEYCHDIRESGRYLLDVINDILDMSKIEAGRIKLSLEDIELGAALSDCMRVVAGRAQDKGLSLTSDIVNHVHFRADNRALKQIVLNLLSNAVKFTPEGGRVAVRARQSAGSIVIAIEDSGIGIPKAALTKLGRPFEQVESQLTKRFQGSGLGLAIAKSLTELHGGAMRIRSTLGAGTIVLVRLPVDGQPSGRIEISETLH